MSDMTFQQAQDILAHIVAQRVRWGKLYDPVDDVGAKKVSDALLAYAQNETHEVEEIRKSLTTANRQLAAAGARETKQKKKIEVLKKEIDNLNAVIDRAGLHDS